MPPKTSLMTMTGKRKLITVVFGTITCALITAALGAFDFWIFTYTESPNLFLYEYAVWLATIVGAVMGFISGAVLGLFLSFRRYSPLFGALAGTIGSIAILLFLAVSVKFPSGDNRVDLMIAVFVPIGAISGALTSLVVSQVRSWAEGQDGRHVVATNQPARRGRTLLD